jgi:hypothetical protein
VLEPVPLSDEGDLLCRGFVAIVAVGVAVVGGVFPMNLGDDVDVLRWCCDGRVLYALEGREMDEEGLDPFFRLPTM